VVVVVDAWNCRLSLWRLDDGIVWKHLGSQGTEPGQFTYPRAVAVTGAGALVVTDMHRVQVLTVDCAVLCVLDPTAVVGVGRLGLNLSGVALYPGTDEILVTDCLNHRVVALSWSSEVCCHEQCCLYPAFSVGGCIGLMMGFFVLFVLFSVAYWMRGHLAVEAHKWASSMIPLGL
jgi:hypothetical protein